MTPYPEISVPWPTMSLSLSLSMLWLDLLEFSWMTWLKASTCLGTVWLWNAPPREHWLILTFIVSRQCYLEKGWQLWEVVPPSKVGTGNVSFGLYFLWPLSLSPALGSLDTMRWIALDTCSSYQEVLPHNRPRINGTKWLQRENSKSMNPNEPLLQHIINLKCFVPAIRKVNTSSNLGKTQPQASFYLKIVYRVQRTL